MRGGASGWGEERPAAKTEKTIAPKVIWLPEKVNALTALFRRPLSLQPHPALLQQQIYIFCGGGGSA